MWGDPSGYIEPVHDAGGIVMHTVGVAEEARRSVASGVAAVLALGAQAAWLGTRFLLAEEMPIHEDYRRRLIAPRPRPIRSCTRTCTRSGGPTLPTARSATQRPTRERRRAVPHSRSGQDRAR